MPRALSLPPLDTAPAPLSDAAYASIRERIVRGRVPARSPLREADLVRELGISRTPVREALRRLQAEGLLRPLPHSGYVVVEWDPHELRSVYAVRIALERLSARSASERRTRLDLAELADTLDAIRAAPDPDDVAALNMRFHLLIARASGNAYLRASLGQIAEIFHRYPAAELTLAGRRDEVLAEHEALLDALTARDGERAERTMQQHLERGMGSLLGERAGRGAARDATPSDAPAGRGGSP